MRIVINHLTRMKPPYICIAGIDPRTSQHVRPVLTGGQQLTASLLACHNGPFELAEELDLGRVAPTGAPPEVEDCIFDAASVVPLRQVPASEFWLMLQRLAKPSLRDIFGADLHAIGATSCGVDLGKGNASLGCLIPFRAPRLHVRPRAGKLPQIRMQLSDATFQLDLSVTDIRLCKADHATPDDRVVSNIDRRLHRGVRVVLAVGLTRAFATTPAFPAVHWTTGEQLAP
jgi:hypothetical protein